MLCRILILLLSIGLTGTTQAQTFESELIPLLENSCFHCHDGDSESGLNLEELKTDFADSKTFAVWERVFDRISKGEMPPPTEPDPDAKQLVDAKTWLTHQLRRANLERRAGIGRVAARRLTKRELNYTLNDLFKITGDFTSDVPDEIESDTFDTVGRNQRIADVHLEAYFSTAENAVREAIQLNQNPYRDYGDLNKNNYAHLAEWHNKPLDQGGSITKKHDSGKGIVLFHDIDYLTQFTYSVHASGIYRIHATIAGYQSETPITAKFIIKSDSGNARLAKAIDVLPDQPTKVSFDVYLQQGERPYLTFVDPGKAAIYLFGAQKYKGPGLAIFSQRIEGPIHESWPPHSMENLFGKLMTNGKLVVPPTTDAQLNAARKLLQEFAPRVFRRDISDEELKGFLEISNRTIEDNRGFVPAIKLALRSMLSSPNFLLFNEQPGQLNDFAIANRLAYFLWRSMPDENLMEMARAGKLSDPDNLRAVIDNMIADPKCERFYKDFVGQWLRIYHVNATTPDDGLFPEFDELLADSIPKETELFFAELVKENLPARNLIDSEFTFLNRRLAEHYEIDGVTGQEFRKFPLDKGSVRGGVLTQAAVLKTTANGTTTSPVIRGNFVLTNFLGTPPPPPPPEVGSIEPDTRGRTTIRDILDAHRSNDSCNQCHRLIDPPGFALESFNPIGGFRKNYRADGGQIRFGGFTRKNPPRKGPRVDPSGVTVGGDRFENIEQFKTVMLKQEEQVARNLVSRLIVFSTGAEIEFADRQIVEQILDETRDKGFRLRDLIYAVVQSELFLTK